MPYQYPKRPLNQEEKDILAKVIEPNYKAPVQFSGDADWHPDDDKFRDERAIRTAYDFIETLDHIRQRIGQEGAD